MKPVTLGEVLARLRKDNGLSQDRASRALGVNQATLSAWEQNKRVPSLEMLQALDKLYVSNLAERFGEQLPAAGRKRCSASSPAPEVEQAEAETVVQQAEADDNPAAEIVPEPEAEHLLDHIPPHIADYRNMAGRGLPLFSPANEGEAAILGLVLAELDRAKTIHPHWPDDPIHAAAILGEESGELTQAALDFCYSGGDLERMRVEAIQCGAMALRFLEHIETYRRTRDAGLRAEISGELRGILNRLESA